MNVEHVYTQESIIRKEHESLKNRKKNGDSFPKTTKIKKIMRI